MLSLLKRLPFKKCFYDTLTTPTGFLYIIGSSEGLHVISWNKGKKAEECKRLIEKLPKKMHHPLITLVKKELGEYFKGERKEFTVPLAPYGTDFQKQAWMALRKISYGKTISYQEQAIKLGDKNKARAVGMANSKNPISIIVPCHRVIGKSGALTGFGGGVSNKELLLNLERE